LDAGIVSKAALSAGGYAHGIIPRALVTVANQHTPKPESVSLPVQSETLRSIEGAGKELLNEDYEGRLTMEVVMSMHEVGNSFDR